MREHFQWSRHPRPRLACILILVALGGSGCASAGGSGARHESCGLRGFDSTFAAAGPVYRDCAVDTKAQAINPNARLDFQPPRGGSNCYSAEVEFVVSATGSPEMNTARVVHTNDRSFAQALLTAIEAWRYRPAVKDGQHVRQIVSERRMAQTSVVLVRAGSAPPSRLPENAIPPSC